MKYATGAVIYTDDVDCDWIITTSASRHLSGG